MEQSEAAWSRVEHAPCGVVFSRLEQAEAVWSRVEPCGAVAVL